MILFKNLLSYFYINNSYDKENILKLIFYLSKIVSNYTDFVYHRNTHIDFLFIKLKFLFFKYKKLKYPIEYILKKINFCNEDFYLKKKIFIPRKETEDFIFNIKKYLKNNPKKILDLCCGSGIPTCIFKKIFPDAFVYGIDKSYKAIRLANKNSYFKNLQINFIRNNIFKEIDNYSKNIDFVFFNPPYISKKYFFDSYLLKEPKYSLIAKDDGAYFYKIFFNRFYTSFNEKTKFLIEFGYNQKEIIEKILLNIGIKNFMFIKDIFDNDRFLLINFN